MPAILVSNLTHKKRIKPMGTYLSSEVENWFKTL